MHIRIPNTQKSGGKRHDDKKELLTISEVSGVTEVPVHTLRFWEGEFGDFLAPIRTNGRQRRYDETAVETVLTIKDLLRKERFSIAGAKQVLSRRGHELSN
ncbi:MAG: MerR family transcriptional regulator [Pseudomonadota bacterium]